MYEQLKLDATPKTARKLLTFANLAGINVADNIKIFAAEGLVSEAQLSSLPITLTDPQKNALQYLLDHDGRALLLSEAILANKLVTLSYAEIENKYPMLILTKKATSLQTAWADLVGNFRAAKVNVFGSKISNRKEGNVTYSKEPEEGQDVYITGIYELTESNLLVDIRPELIIADDLEATGRHQFDDMNQGLFKETESVIMLYRYDSKSLPQPPTTFMEAMATLKSTNKPQETNNHWSGYPMVISTMVHGLFSHVTAAEDLLARSKFSSHVKAKGYNSWKTIDYLRAMGLCVEMILDDDLPAESMTFTDRSHLDDDVLKEKHQVAVKRFETAYGNLPDILRTVLTRSDLSSFAVQPLMQDLENLSRGSFSAAKMLLIKEVLNYLSPRDWASKTIFVANSHLLSATLNKDFDCARLSGLLNLEDKNVQKIIKKFKESVKEGNRYHDYGRVRTAASFAYACLPELLEQADYLVFAHYPLDQKIYERIKELAKIYKVKVINPVLLGTFEEEAVKILDPDILSKGLS